MVNQGWTFAKYRVVDPPAVAGDGMLPGCEAEASKTMDSRCSGLAVHSWSGPASAVGARDGITLTVTLTVS